MTDVIKVRLKQLKNNEVPEGYKQNKKYIYPQLWNIIKMGRVTERISKRNKDSVDYPAYSINNQIGFIPQNEQFEASSYQDLDKSSYKIVEKGQFAYNPARINVGSIGLLKNTDTVIVSSLYVCFRLNKGYIPIYFDNWFTTYDFHKEILRNLEGSVREYLVYENFSNIMMPVPPLKEQQKIVEILTQCDKIIELKKQLIEEETKRKKWLMKKLLTPKKGWKKQTIGSISNVCAGATPSTKQIKYWNGNIRWMNSGELNKKVIFEVQGRISQEGLNNSGTKLLPEKCVLIGLAGQGKTRGTVAINYIPLCTNQSIAAILPNESFNSEYMFWELENRYSELRKISSGDGARGGLNLELIKGFVFYAPTVSEQIKIANVLFQQNKQLNLIEDELKQWQLKKKSLMQLLLTGIVRVKV